MVPHSNPGANLTNRLRAISSFLLFFLMAAGCDGSGDDVQSTANHDIYDMQQIRKIILSEMGPDFVPADDLETAFAIRDYIYRRIPVVDTKGFSFDNFLEAFEQSAISGQLCEGIAINYVIAMESLGIPARKVEMYTEAVDAPTPVVSHAVAEVYIDGQWIAMDPRYNTSLWADEDTPIGWQEIRERCLQGDTVYVSDDGYTATRMNIDEIPYCDYVDYMVFAPKRLDDGYHEGFFLPDDWDGIIRYNDGSALDVGEFYDYDLRLAEALWR
jgi:hypothetical protein